MREPIVGRAWLVFIVPQHSIGSVQATDMKSKRGGMKGKLIIFFVVIAAIGGALVYFAGKADDSLPPPEEKRIEVDNVL
jgi:hypothetical protein